MRIRKGAIGRQGNRVRRHGVLDSEKSSEVLQGETMKSRLGSPVVGRSITRTTNMGWVGSAIATEWFTIGTNALSDEFETAEICSPALPVA